METVFRELDTPDFDINNFKTNHSTINDKVSSVLDESSKLNNDMNNIMVNATNEINKYKAIIDIKDDNLNNTLNHIQWNYYYYKRYRKINEILLYYIVVCIVLIVLSKLQSPYFDNLSYSLITGIIIAALFIYVMFSLWDLFIRDNINFDEYDFSKYGTGIQSDYNPDDTVDYSYNYIVDNYDYSGCLFYSNLTANSQSNAAHSQSSSSQSQSMSSQSQSSTSQLQSSTS